MIYIIPTIEHNILCIIYRNWKRQTLFVITPLNTINNYQIIYILKKQNDNKNNLAAN